MARFSRLFLITLVLMGLLLSTTAALVGCGGDTTTTGASTAATTATTVTKDSATVLGDRALKVLAATPTGQAPYASNVITGADLATKLADPAEKAKLYLLDIRKKADYDTGHIAGATQVEFAQWAAPENLTKLPKDKKIIVICYTGNTAAQAGMGLRMLGFDAAVLKAGMNGWAQSAMTQTVVNDLASTDNPVVTTATGAAAAAAPPAGTLDKPADADYKILAEKAASVMSMMETSGDFANNTISPVKLSAKLADTAEKAKLFVIDIRAKADYDKGHIDGATNIPFAAVAVPDNLKMLPKDKKVIVACYTGNTAAQAVIILRMMGYDANVLKYGMMGWDGTQKDAYLAAIQAAGNPTVTT